MKCTLLSDRSLVRIDGDAAMDFLQNLVTCDMEMLKAGDATFGALLTPQGKILFDFFCVRTQAGFLFDIADDMRPDFIKRMMFYRLRAPVEIAPVDDGKNVYAFWGDDQPSSETGELTYADPRLATMGFRRVADTCDTNADMDDYTSHRVALGMPEGGKDYAHGGAFPHDAMMDQFDGAGVAFDKGCYVGQEVVSRMKHRGTARRRIVQVIAEQQLPASDSSVEAGGKVIGTLRSVSGSKGLAMVRIDRLAKARDAGDTLSIEGVEITAQLPEWSDIALENK